MSVIGVKEYTKISEIRGPLIIVEGVSRVAYDEVVEVELSSGERRRGRVLEVTRNAAVVQVFEGKDYDAGSLLELYGQLVEEFSVAYLEDPFHEEDTKHFAEITSRLGSKVLIVGDDIYATNVRYLMEGVKARATNGALVKVNQVGTLTETLEYVRMARDAGVRPVISHRSGDTEDPFIADLAVAVGAGVIKTGAPARSERLAKYNRLLEIEDYLGPVATYAGRAPFASSL